MAATRANHFDIAIKCECHACFEERAPCCQSSECWSALHGRLSEYGKITTKKLGVLVSTVDTYFCTFKKYQYEKSSFANYYLKQQ